MLCVGETTDKENESFLRSNFNLRVQSQLTLNKVTLKVDQGCEMSICIAV